MILLTPSLVLRPCEPDDVEELVAVYEQQELTARFSPPRKRDPDSSFERISNFVAREFAADAKGWTVLSADESEIIGLVDLSIDPEVTDDAHLGFILGNGSAADGRAREALLALLVHTALEEKLRVWTRLQLGVLTSERLIRAIGFKVQAHMRGEADRERERRDYRIYRLEF